MTATMADMTAEFLAAILPTQKDGWLTGAVGHGGHFNGSGKYEFDRFEPYEFEWPAQRDLAIAHIQKWAPTCDTYICPYLMETRDRIKGNAAWRQIVHCDCDKGVDLDKVHQLGGFVIWSGTPGHGHVYILLSHVVMPPQHEALERGLVTYLDGDPGKISDNDLLRPSGSRNQKAAASGGTAGFVVLADTFNVAPVDPFDLAKTLNIDINAHSGGQQPAAPADSNAREQIDLNLYPSVSDELDYNTGDQSKDTYRVICACIDIGLNLAQTRWVVDQRPAMADRVARFLARTPPVDDVAESWQKALNEWQRLHQTAAASPQAAAAPPGAPLPGPGRFFGHQGLRALELADEVAATITCGYGHLDERFYTYSDGVWTPGEAPIEAEIVRLLGNRYRIMHTHNITTIIKHQPHTARITDEPLVDYINVPNGMIRWETGGILGHNPDYRSTVQLPVEYVPGATCPRFEKFLAEVLPPDLLAPTADGPGFIWELIGYTLYSGNPLHIAVLLLGKGRNGKGTLIRVLKELLGENNYSAVTLHELTENRFRVASLYQKLANLAGDLDSKWLENTALFKKITGHDALQGEYKYGGTFNFSPWALPFYSANKAFGSPDSSEGWVARWVVVPFPHSFLGREDRTLDTRLTSESELRGILVKGVEALPALMARGNFTEPQSLADAKTAFVVASDAVRAWLDEHCVIEPGNWIPRTDLYKKYRWDSSLDGAKQLGAREFYNRVEQVGGVVTAIRKGTRGFGGVRMKSAGA